MMRFFSLLTLFFFSILKIADAAEHYCNLLWINDNLPRASVSISLDSGSSGIMPLNLQAGGVSTIINRYEQNMSGFVTLDGITRYWIQYPEEWLTTTEGLKYRIISNLETAGVQSAGVKTVVTPVNKNKWVNTYGCMNKGEKYDFGTMNIPGLSIEVERGTAWPGSYSLHLPVKIAYEENKGNFSGNNGSGWHQYADAMRDFKTIDSSNINVVISSRCEIQIKELTVNMGDNITPAEARSGVIKKIDIPVQCNSPANITLSVKGMDIINNVYNRTKCGSGYCEISFENGLGKINSSVNGGRVSIPVIVLYKDNNAQEGMFYGNATLSMNVN